LDEETHSSQKSWLEFHLLLRVQLLGDRTQIVQHLGLPDVAAAVLRDEKQAAHELDGFSSGVDGLLRAALDEIVFDMAVQNFHAAVALCDSLLVSSCPLFPDQRVAVLGYKALALSWLAREEHEGVAQEASQLLLSLLGEPDLPQNVREELLLAAVGLELGARDFEAAQAHLNEAHALLDVKSRDVDPCHGDDERDMAIAYGARLALERQSPGESLRKWDAVLGRACDAILARVAKLPLRRGGVGFLHWANPRVVLSERIRFGLALNGAEQGAERAVETIAAAQTEGTIARSLNLPAVDMREIRKYLLGADHGLLLYLPSCDRTHLVVVDSDTARCFELGPRGVLLAAIASFEARSSAPPEVDEFDEARADSLRSLGETARRLLLPDEALAEMRSWSGFYVVGSELLSQAPFEFMPLPSGATMGVEYGVCYLPSLPFAVWLAKRECARDDASRTRLLVFAASSTRSSDGGPATLEPLAFSSADRLALSGSRAGGQCVFLEGERATRESLFGDELASVRMLEIFAHGILDSTRERPAGLACGGVERGQALWCDDVEAGFRSPPIVGLFACGSGYGKARLGDDCSSQLSASFLLQGADTVFVGRAPLAFGAMIELARELDQGLCVAGLSRAEALRRARQSLARNRRWSDPFYFANVSLVGLGWTSRPDSQTPVAAGRNPTKTAESGHSWGLWAALCGTIVGSIALVITSRNRRRRKLPTANASS
jgi:hypothetical protein